MQVLHGRTPDEITKEERLLQKLKEKDVSTPTFQMAITDFAIKKQINKYERKYNQTSSLAFALIEKEISGKFPTKTPTRTRKKINFSQYATTSNVPDATILCTKEHSKEEQIFQQGACLTSNWNAYLQFQKKLWNPLGGTPILGDQQVSYLRTEYQMPRATVQRFDPSGSYLTSGYSYGEIMLHDFSDFLGTCSSLSIRYNSKSYLNRRKGTQDKFSGCSFIVTEYPMEDQDGARLRTKNGEKIYAFQYPVVRFSP